MRRLYLRIYLAVLVSLAVFAVCSGLVWRQFGDAGAAGHAFEVAGTLAQNVLPAAGAPKAEQQAALEQLAAKLPADVALFAADRSLLATVGEQLTLPSAGRDRGGWLRHWGRCRFWTCARGPVIWRWHTIARRVATPKSSLPISIANVFSMNVINWTANNELTIPVSKR